MSEDYSKDGKYVLPTGEYLHVSNGSKFYYKDKSYKILHRENNLPAIEYTNGAKHWCVNNKLHRENDLPAIEYADGNKEWWLNGFLHRESGPALEFANGKKYWCFNDEYLPVETKEEFEKYKKFKHFF